MWDPFDTCGSLVPLLSVTSPVWNHSHPSESIARAPGLPFHPPRGSCTLDMSAHLFLSTIPQGRWREKAKPFHPLQTPLTEPLSTPVPALSTWSENQVALNSNKKWHFTPSDTLNSGADRNCLNPGSWGWVGEERGKRAGEGFLGCLTCPSAPLLHPPPGSTPPAVLWVGSPRGPILSVLLIYFWVLEGKPTKQANLYYSDNDQ